MLAFFLDRYKQSQSPTEAWKGAASSRVERRAKRRAFARWRVTSPVARRKHSPTGLLIRQGSDIRLSIKLPH
jgi:hypothetical protein